MTDVVPRFTWNPYGEREGRDLAVRDPGVGSALGHRWSPPPRLHRREETLIVRDMGACRNRRVQLQALHCSELEGRMLKL